MHCQRILYDQLNTDYIHPDVEKIYIIITTQTAVSPYGPLQFNPHSQLYNYATIQTRTQEIQTKGYKAECIIADNYTKAREIIQQKEAITHISIMESAEPYHQKHIEQVIQKTDIPYTWITNTQFLVNHELFLQEFPKPPIMETFYRRMRKKYNILMDGNKPIGGKRNFDKDNRSFDKTHESVSHHTYTNIYRTQAQSFYKNIRTKNPPAYTLPVDIYTQSSLFPLTREQSQEALDYFIDHHLNNFGRLEDAMYTQDQLVYHSILSGAINIGLLRPQEVIDKITAAETAIQNKEGYIRQLLGRREYMYHFFSYYQESIYTENYLQHHIPLPTRFREPDQSPLKMHCINTTLQTVKNIGYSHHITRLMVIGNFCQLVGINPHHVNKRFWEMYTDAYERVVTPNVLSMSQYADGGKLATKPYVSSANYINKMSNYCKSCAYDPNEKYGPNACPLNYLYRRYVEKNKELFIKGRQPFILKHLDKLDMDTIQEQSDQFIKKNLSIDN